MINIHIYPSQFENESRILKITHTLSKYGFFEKIYMLGVLDSKKAKNLERLDSKRIIIRVNRFVGSFKNILIIKLWKSIVWYINVLFLLKKKKISCINCHSLPVLPLCVILKLLNGGSKLIYDTHELETETIGARGIKKILYKIVEYLFITYADEVIVVNDSIAKWYSSNYKINKPFVIKNIPMKPRTMPKNSGMIKDKLGLKKSDILFVYQGNLSKGRGIEKLLNVFSKISDKYIVFIGNGSLEKLVKSSNSINIFHHDSVPMNTLINYTHGCDVGISIIENTCLSYYLSLPNKVFEYLLAGIPMVVNDLPEQVKIIKEYSCGWVRERSSSLEDLIKNINLNDINTKKEIIRNKISCLGWHSEEQKILEIYKSIVFTKH